MAKKMEESAPKLWRLLSVLLSADPKRTYSQEWAQQKVAAANLKACLPLASPTSDMKMRHPASENLENNDDYFRYFDDILLNEDDGDEPEVLKERSFSSLILS